MALTKISTDGVKDDAVTAGKIPANAVGASELADNAVDTNAIADQAVTLAKLPHGDGSSNGKFLRANNGGDPSFESIPASGISNLVEDTSPQLGGNLASNGNNIIFADTTGADNNRLVFGANTDMSIYHEPNNNYIDADTGTLHIRHSTETGAKFIKNGGVELYHDNSKKFETSSSGITVNGAALVGGNIEINTDAYFKLGASYDLSLTHSGGNSYIENSTGYLFIQGNDVAIRSAAGTNRIISSGSSVDLFYGTNAKLSTISTGVNITGGIRLGGNNAANEMDDYEEGTFTPTFNFSGSSGSITYDVQIGRYTKIGNRVFYTCIIRSTNATGSVSGQLRIAGLPFAVNSDFPSGGTVFFLTGGNFSTDYGVAIQLNTSEQIEFYTQGQSSSTNYSFLTPSGLNVGALFIKIEGHYQT